MSFSRLVPDLKGLRPEKVDLRPETEVFSPERADFSPEMAWGGRTNKQRDVRKSPCVCVLQDIVPFGAAAQKGERAAIGMKADKDIEQQW